MTIAIIIPQNRQSPPFLTHTCVVKVRAGVSVDQSPILHITRNFAKAHIATAQRMVERYVFRQYITGDGDRCMFAFAERLSQRSLEDRVDPPPEPQSYIYQPNEHRNFDQGSDHHCKSYAGIDPKYCNGNCDG